MTALSRADAIEQLTHRIDQLTAQRDEAKRHLHEVTAQRDDWQVRCSQAIDKAEIVIEELRAENDALRCQLEELT